MIQNTKEIEILKGGILMSLCPVCGRAYCDHTPKERGQTEVEMTRPLTDEEQKVWEEEPDGSLKKIAVAKKHAHDPV
ncbi:hypothetical protein C4546_04470 [Candidatus Parcubacteria bacterium]|jgi:hypothetical protein|nr:MAG: hypothetical protein C4546_04470 [Candidatus Parcubacteria bacterium]